MLNPSIHFVVFKIVYAILGLGILWFSTKILKETCQFLQKLLDFLMKIASNVHIWSELTAMLMPAIHKHNIFP